VSSRSNEIKVGIVALAGLILFVVVLVYLGGIEQLWTRYTVFDVIYDDVQGLDTGAEVQLAGVGVGSVEAIRFDGLGGKHDLELQLQLEADVAGKLKTRAGQTITAVQLAALLPAAGDQDEGETVVFLQWVEPTGSVRTSDATASYRMGRLVSLSLDAEGGSATVMAADLPIEKVDRLGRADRPMIRAGSIVLGVLTAHGKPIQRQPPQAAVRVTVRVSEEAGRLIHQDARVVILKTLTGQIVLNVEESGISQPIKNGDVLYGPETTAFYEIAKELGIGAPQRKDLATILRNIANMTTRVTEWLDINGAQITASLGGLRSATGRLDKLLQTGGPHVDQILTKVQQLAENLAQVVQNNSAGVDATIADIRDTAAELKAIIAENRPHVLSISKGVDRFVANVNAAVDRETLQKIAQNVRSASQTLNEALDVAKRTVQQGHDLLAENRPAMGRMVRSAESAANWLRLTAKEISAHPWRLISPPGKEISQARDIYRAAREFNEGATVLENAADELRVLMNTIPEAEVEWRTQLEKKREELQKLLERLRKLEKELWKKLGGTE